MILTVAQLATLKSNVVADPVLSLITRNPDGYIAIADAYNLIVNPTFFVYRTNVPVVDIYNQITWAKLTPTDAPDGTLAWECRAIACQGKQFNLQILLQGLPAIDASRTNIRAGLNDALSSVPSGASGAVVSAGWASVRDNALARAATRAEKLFADTSAGDGTTAGSAATMTAQGAMTGADVTAAFAS